MYANASSMALTLLALVNIAGCWCHAEQSPSEVDAAQIAAWIKKLGREEFEDRKSAFENLKTAGELAIPLLEETARTSIDLEVRTRAEELLPYARGAGEAKQWKSAIASEWIPSLRKGALAGPLFGAQTISTEVVEKLKGRTFSMGGPQRPNPNGDARDAALEWLCRTQGKDGRWDTIAYGSEISGDIEQTSLAIFAFLGAGHTEKVGLYRENVQSAISWLLRHQREDGAILPPGWSEVDGLRHALGGLALAEAASMSRMPVTRAAAQKAVDYSLRHQSKVGEALSGFGRQAQSASPDLLSTAFFTMQLKSAKVMGLKVDPMAFDGIIRFLDSVDAKSVKEGGFFSYVQDGKATPEATLIGCAVRRLLGWKREDLALQAGTAVKAFGNPTVGQVDSNAVVNYFGTLVLFQQGGNPWKSWDKAMKKSLFDLQAVGGDADGSWAPSGIWTGSGRVFATAMNAICLQVYYRYLPLYYQ